MFYTATSQKDSTFLLHFSLPTLLYSIISQIIRFFVNYKWKTRERHSEQRTPDNLTTPYYILTNHSCQFGLLLG